MVLKDLNNTTTTTASDIVLMQKKQGTMKSTTLQHHQHHQLQRHHRPREGRVIVIPKWAHHHGTTMKGTSIIMTMMIMVFIVINIVFMTAIILPHQGVQGFTTLPDFPRSPIFAFPNPPSFPEKKIEELFMQCGREVLEDRFFTEMTYSVKDFYRCDISQFWLKEAHRDGIYFPLHEKMHMNRDENDMHMHKFDNGMHKYDLRPGTHIFYDGREMHMDRNNDMKSFENEREWKDYRNTEMRHFFDNERRDDDMPRHRRELDTRDRYFFNTERFGNEMTHREELLKREEESCRRAERAEYCLGGDMMVSCMWRKSQLMVREEMERKEEKSFEEAKRFLGRMQEYLEGSLCKRFGVETLQCERPMQELGFSQWPLTPMYMKTARFPLGGCRMISKRF